jgi:hypothetical protein
LSDEPKKLNKREDEEHEFISQKPIAYTFLRTQYPIQLLEHCGMANTKRQKLSRGLFKWPILKRSAKKQRISVVSKSQKILKKLSIKGDEKN